MRRAAAIPLSLLTLLAACKDSAQADASRSEPAASSTTQPQPEQAVAPPTTEPAPTPAPIDPAILAIVDRVDQTRYAEDLRFIAAERPPGSPHWQAVQDRCAQLLAEQGFTVERFGDVEPPPPGSTRKGVNVIGTLPGSDPNLPAIIVGAHYDHIPACAGANDNGSGLAALFELARVLGRQQQPEGWRRSLVLACWDEEESGLYGSTAWLDHQIAQGKAIDLYLNFDTMGYTDRSPNSQRLPPGLELLFPREYAELEKREFRADFIGVLADSKAAPTSARLLAHAERLELPAMGLTIPDALKNAPAAADLRRSDHAAFWAHDIPAVFLSDTADFRSDTYHCTKRADSFETVDLAFVVDVVRASAGTLAELLRG